MNTSDWIEITPEVNSNAEFLEILYDFGNPLEIIREAISNSIDAGANYISINIKVREIDGSKKLVIEFEDDGKGMDYQTLTRDFWGLGFSQAREIKKSQPETIGEKGHGTKIFLRSNKVIVETQSEEGAYHSVCDNPLGNLHNGKLHQPRTQSISRYMENTGTKITVIGYNDSERSQFVQDTVKDYIIWFTKVGSIELQFGITRLQNFSVFLKCLDVDKVEEIPFGHVFPPENSNINELFRIHGANAADWYVKYYSESGRLKRHPEVRYEIFVCVEGDEVKRDYNPMIRERLRSDNGRYRVADRYGLWICKDYIPVDRKNEWIVGFGSGSNAFTMLHGFVNCQSLKLTANRGTIANTDPQILEELQEVISR